MVSCGVVYVILRFAALVELRLVSDKQTDTDRPMASTADAWHRAVKIGKEKNKKVITDMLKDIS